MEKTKFISDNRDLGIVLIIYSILALFSINYYHFNLGADGISYISIALKYVNGDWANAINGVWSPLYSWLLTPMLLVGFNPFNAPYVTRIVSLIVGFFTIISINKLATTFELQDLIKKCLLLTSIPLILFFALFYDTPDLLVACLLIFYFSIIFQINYFKSPKNGLWCGLAGSLAFLSKSYVFIFFIVHFSFFNLVYYFKCQKIDRNQIKRNLLIGLAVFFIISGLWIGTLSEKYGKTTISTAVDFNHAIVGPNYLKQQDSLGLIKPPNPTATSIWEDPSTIQLNDWNAFASWENFEFQLKIIINNIYLTLFLFEYYSILSLAIILISLYFIMKRKTEKIFKTRLIYLMITTLIYSAGYCLLFIQERFFYPVILLLMIWGFFIVSKLFEKDMLISKVRTVLLILLIGSFILAPLYGFTTFPSSTDSEKTSKILNNDLKIHGKIASNDLWVETDKIAFYLNSQYYGVPKNINNSSELEKELMANNITYYFVWGESDNIPHSCKEITNAQIKDLKIFQILNTTTYPN